jgi:prepilin-type N-terminal cleavage/methylation domain-containing protein
MMRQSRGSRAGYTLVELMVAMVLLAVVMVALFGTIMSVQRDYSRQRDTMKASETLRYAEGVVSSVLRAAESNPRGIDSTLVRLDPNPLNRAAFDNIRVRADFNPADGDVNDPLEDVLLSTANDTLYVRWRASGPVEPLAYPVRSLRFDYYSATGVALTQRAQVDTAKRVKVTMTAPGNSKTPGGLYQKEAWVFLRNRS